MPLVSHACSLEASMWVINGIPLGCSLLLTVGTVNSVQTRKVMNKEAQAILLNACSASPGARGEDGKYRQVEGPEALVMLAGMMNRNGYSVRNVLRPNTVVGLGLFPAVAMLNHSCAPNCAIVTNIGGVLEVRTLATVPTGCELTVSYTNLLATCATRRTELASKEFTCHCTGLLFPLTHPLQPRAPAICVKPVCVFNTVRCNNAIASPRCFPLSYCCQFPWHHNTAGLRGTSRLQCF
jgi:hypothetical protein